LWKGANLRKAMQADDGNDAPPPSSPTAESGSQRCGARGKRRGFSPGAAACHSHSARVPWKIPEFFNKSQLTVSIRHQDAIQSATLWWLHPQCEIQQKNTGAQAVGFKFIWTWRGLDCICGLVCVLLRLWTPYSCICWHEQNSFNWITGRCTSRRKLSGRHRHYQI